MKDTVLTTLQLIFAVLLVLTILLQQKGGGLGNIFGGTGNIYSTKRGIDKILHYSTIVFAIIFCGISIGRLVF